MRFKIPYGKETLDVEINEEVAVLLPNRCELGDESDLIKKALEHPMGKEKFEEFASFYKSLLIVVNDGTRPTPTARIIKGLYPVLSRHPKVRFIVATGAHRAPTIEEYKMIFGKYYDEFKDRILVHEARKDEDMVHLGTSSNGTEMYINKAVIESENVLVLGSVEPHYFAGYTGGRKSFLPGLASYKTIEMNHRLALSNRARTLALDGNPVHEDMMEALTNIKNINIFSIQTVLTGDHRIYAVTAGDLYKSFEAAIEHANQVFRVPLKAKGNIVLTVASYPMDVDLYQTQKAIDNGKFALTMGGVLIFVSKCSGGIGGKTFYELLSQSDTPQGVLYKINRYYKLGFHKAAKMAQIGVWAKVWGVTSLPDDLLRNIKVEPYHDIQCAVDSAIRYIRGKGEKPRIVILPNGSLTVPVLEGSETVGGFVKVRTEIGVKDILEVLDIDFES